MNSVGKFLTVLSSVALAGCAATPELRSARQGSAPGKALSWTAAPQEEPLTAGETAAREQIGRALEGAGYRFTQDAPVLVDIGVAERASEIGLTRIGEAQTISVARPRGLIAACRTKHILRLTLHLTDRASGRELYSGSAEERRCKAESGPVLQRLGETLVADLSGRPG